MIINIFYSWQSDLEMKSHRYFIEKMLKAAIDNISKESSLIAIIDRDTKGNTGSPDIFATIMKKIDRSRIFVCDLSIVSAPDKPNSNVLIELGYAIKTLGWDKIICLFDKESGKIEDLPFNINHNRITPYGYNKSEDDVPKIGKIVSDTITRLHSNGLLFDSVEDYVKAKIDYVLLEILNNLDGVFFSSLKTQKPHQITDILNLSIDDFTEKFSGISFIGFYFVQSYSLHIPLLENLLDRLFLTNSFDDKAKTLIVNLIRWIESWDDLVSQRFQKDLFVKQKNSDYRVIDMHKENSLNPIGSCILIKPINETSSKVVRGGTVEKYNFGLAPVYLSINKNHIKFVSKTIYQCKCQREIDHPQRFEIDHLAV